MQDNKYVPDTIEITGGEACLVFTNNGAATHDAYIGDEAAQDSHESEMNGDPGGHGMNGDSGAVTVEPGDSAELTHTLAARDDVLTNRLPRVWPLRRRHAAHRRRQMTCGITLSYGGESLVPLVGVDALEVRAHNFPVDGVAVFDEGVLHHGIDNSFLVVSGEIEPAPGARLGVGHRTIEAHVGHQR